MQKPVYALRSTEDGKYYAGGIQGNHDTYWDDSLVRLFTRLDMISRFGRRWDTIEVLEVTGLQVGKVVPFKVAEKVGKDYRNAVAAWKRRSSKARNNLYAEIMQTDAFRDRVRDSKYFTACDAEHKKRWPQYFTEPMPIHPGLNNEG